MCNLWIYSWEINKDKLRDHTDVQSLNLSPFNLLAAISTSKTAVNSEVSSAKSFAYEPILSTEIFMYITKSSHRAQNLEAPQLLQGTK